MLVSNVGTASSVTLFFSTDLCFDSTAKLLLGATCAGATPPDARRRQPCHLWRAVPGVPVFIADANASSEQNVVNVGGVAISVIEDNDQPTNDTR